MYLVNWGECFLYFRLFLVVSSSFTQIPPVCCYAVTLSTCPDAAGASGWEKFHWAWLGLAPSPHFWALLTGSVCIIHFILCCFWLAAQWESPCEFLCDGSTLGLCASAGSLAQALATRVQVEDTAVFHWSNAFFLGGVRIIWGNQWAWKS